MVPETVNGRSNGDHRITFNHPDDTYSPCAEALADAPGGVTIEIEAWSVVGHLSSVNEAPLVLQAQSVG